MPRKRFYTVTYIPPDQKGDTQLLLENTVSANSPYHAARLCLKQWLRKELIKRQPKGDDAGGFEGVEVEIL